MNKAEKNVGNESKVLYQSIVKYAVNNCTDVTGE